MLKTFFDAIGTVIDPTEVAEKNGLSYLAAATAVRLANRPEVTFVDFAGKPYLEMLNGAVVAVDLKIPGTDVSQRMWLPVMDKDNLPLELSKTKATDINNSRQRCLVKAIAGVYGYGLSMYLDCGGDGEKAVKMLGIEPTSKLEEVPPFLSTIKEGGALFIEWCVGLAAARITDPTFHWEVVMWDGLPYRNVLGGLYVDVDTVYRGKRQRLSLPVMDSAFNPVAAEKASVSDWNKTVMRVLTKNIAFSTGYGLSVYADDFGPDKDVKAGRVKTPKGVPTAKAEPAKATPDTAATKAKAEVAASPDEQNHPENVAGTAESNAAVAEVEGALESGQETSDKGPGEGNNVPASATTPTASSVESEAVERFREVLRKRREQHKMPGVIALYDALATSTKFAEADKPACFAVLVTASATQVDGEHILELLGAITKYEAMKHLALDTRDMVAAKLTAVLLTTACAEGDDALKAAPQDLIAAGVAQDVADVVRLAAIGNVPVETVDLMRDVLDMATA